MSEPGPHSGGGRDDDARVPAALKVVTFGNSAGVLVAGSGGSEPPYLNYPAVLDRSQHGDRGFEVTNCCRIAGILPEISGVWATPLSLVRPDVVVLQFGAYDAFPFWLPRSVISYLMGIRRHACPVRDAYWHRAARLLGFLSRSQRALDDRMPIRWGGYVSTARYERELRLICRRISRQTGARIVLMDAYCVTEKCGLSTDGMRARTMLNNETTWRVAADLGLEVFPLAKLVESLDPHRVLGDGMHLDAAAHARVGEELAAFLAATDR